MFSLLSSSRPLHPRFGARTPEKRLAARPVVGTPRA